MRVSHTKTSRERGDTTPREPNPPPDRTRTPRQTLAVRATRSLWRHLGWSLGRLFGTEVDDPPRQALPTPGRPPRAISITGEENPSRALCRPEGECAGCEDRRLSERPGRLPSRGSRRFRTALAGVAPHRPRRLSRTGTPGRRRPRSGTVRGQVRWPRAIDAQASLGLSAATARLGIVPVPAGKRRPEHPTAPSVLGSTATSAATLGAAALTCRTLPPAPGPGADGVHPPRRPKNVH